MLDTLSQFARQSLPIVAWLLAGSLVGFVGALVIRVLKDRDFVDVLIASLIGSRKLSHLDRLQTSTSDYLDNMLAISQKANVQNNTLDPNQLDELRRLSTQLASILEERRALALTVLERLSFAERVIGQRSERAISSVRAMFSKEVSRNDELRQKTEQIQRRLDEIGSKTEEPLANVSEEPDASGP